MFFVGINLLPLIRVRWIVLLRMQLRLMRLFLLGQLMIKFKLLTKSDMQKKENCENIVIM